MITPSRIPVDHEFWRAQQEKPRVITFITTGQCRSAIGPHDVTADEIMHALHAAARHAAEGARGSR